MSVLEGQLAVVTGGARGLGAAIGEEMARQGARVVLADVQLEEAEATAVKLRTEGLDVTSPLGTTLRALLQR